MSGTYNLEGGATENTVEASIDLQFKIARLFVGRHERGEARQRILSRQESTL